MKVPFAIIALFAIAWLPHVVPQRYTNYIPDAKNNQTRRVTRQASAEQMVQNILQWLESVQTQGSRKVRQDALRTYLPPNTQKPRPFEPAIPDENLIGGVLPPDLSERFQTPQSGEPPYSSTLPPIPSPEPTPHEITGPPEIFSTQPDEIKTSEPTLEPEYPSLPERAGFEEIPSQQPFPVETSSPQEFISTIPEDQFAHEESSSTTETTGYPSEQTPQSPFPPTGPSSVPEEPLPPESTGYPPAGQTPQPPFPTPQIPGQTETSSPQSPSEATEIPNEFSSPSQPSLQPEITGYPPASETPQPSFESESSSVPDTTSQQPEQINEDRFKLPETIAELFSSASEPSQITTSTFPSIIRDSTTKPFEEPSRPETEEPSPIESASPTEELNFSNIPEQPSLPEVNSIKPIPEEVETQEPDETPAQPSLPEINPSEPSQTDVQNIIPSQPPEPEGETESQEPKQLAEEDLKHPPHIHAIDVECAKDMMTINIEFNRQFDGVIYSKGFYSNPECRYVSENSGQTKYTFTVRLDSCGTQFVNAFDTQNQSYLENVLVLQNEARIQEVWDTVRSVRCLWEGSLSKSLTVSLSVGMLSEETVTFSGDTVAARLDIQRGEGPFAPSANGLVPIGEKMTLVVSISGDAGFDLQVKDCKAKDTTGDLEYSLTDENGCVLRPKLFGAFQKMKNTGDNVATVIAYAFFNAFKFPDLMDLMIECNVELCKTDCDVCPDPNQKIQPGKRRRRDIYNETNGEPVKVGKLLRVLLPEDLSNGETIVEVKKEKEFCISVRSFLISSIVFISLLVCSFLLTGYMFLKNRTNYYKHQI